MFPGYLIERMLFPIQDSLSAFIVSHSVGMLVSPDVSYPEADGASIDCRENAAIRFPCASPCIGAMLQREA